MSGFEKIIGPYQNFLYVIQSYELFNSGLENIAAHFMPWVEFLLGVFLVLGLWLKLVLRALAFLIVLFILVVGQALIRDLPITECGCFGELVSFPLWVVLTLDSMILILTGFLIRKEDDTGAYSLDHYFGGQGG